MSALLVWLSAKSVIDGARSFCLQPRYRSVVWIERCPSRNWIWGRIEILDAIHQPEAIRGILDCFDLLSRSPPVSPAYRILTNRLFAETLDSLSGSLSHMAVVRGMVSATDWEVASCITSQAGESSWAGLQARQSTRSPRLFSVSAQAANNWLPWLSWRFSRSRRRPLSPLPALAARVWPDRSLPTRRSLRRRRSPRAPSRSQARRIRSPTCRRS